ncbi:MAG: sigma-70 family RNA polymerase sigma factor [candidate division KSB1 bacterium]|nr:sigma-70 family RNA polymerase sigma factor [candidate division KSB1 bacterium]
MRLKSGLKYKGNDRFPEADAELVEATRSGNGAAFGKLVEKYQDKLLYLAYDLLGDFDEARDVAQEAFIRAFERIHQFEDRAQFSTWIYRITVNLAMDQHRRRKRRPVDSLEDHIHEIDRQNAEEQAAETLKPEDELHTDLRRRRLNEALQKLSDHQRTAVVLKYFHQKSSREISQVIGCSENTVRIHLFRGLRNLKRHLEKVKNILE